MTEFQYAWLTLDGEKKGPYLVHAKEDGEICLTPEPWMLKYASMETLTSMGIIEMRMK